MINVKKWLVALMAVAMVFSFAGFAGVGVSADDAAPTDPAYVTGWTVDRAESGTTQYADLVKAYAAAKDGDFIYPSEHAVTSKEVLVASEQKKVTINTTEIDFQGKITVTAEGYCLGEKQKGIYTIDKHDVTNVVFSWDFNNVRAKVVESCDNCGSKLALNADGTPVQLEKDKGITVVGAVDCTKDQTITYTATYTSKYQTSKDWTETIERNEKATGHTYGYVQGSLKWVMGTDGKVTKDANGNDLHDDVVKHRLFWDHIAKDWNVIGALDDRARVCAVWEDIGIKCLNCSAINDIGTF